MEPSTKPILVTGATGFLASHCVKQLLEQGYKVRGTVRSLANKSKNQFLYDLVPEKSSNLELVEADLLKPETLASAVEGVDYVLHIASPFPIESPKDENVLIKPAMEGTLSVLRASVTKGVKKVVVTSSIGSAMYGHHDKVCGPEDWSAEELCASYAKSKLKAERAAWKFWEENKERLEMATVLPVFIVGRLYTYVGGSSETLVKDMLTGKLPALPDIYNAVVHVSDVAEIHIKALFSPFSNGKRYIASAEELSFKQMAQILRNEYGQYGYKVTKRGVPNCLINFGALFSKDMKLLKNDLGLKRRFDSGLATKDLGVQFRPARDAFKEMADSLIQLGAVPNLISK